MGSRNINEDDEKFTENLVKKIIKKGYGIVSGGARGIDSVSSETALSNGGIVIEYLSDSLLSKIKKRNTIEALREKKLVLLSASKPDARFNVGMAMGRNKYIYSQSDFTVVIKAENKKGGSWSGAIEALKKEYCPVFCRNNLQSEGNIELISNGAISITENWNIELKENNVKKTENVISSKKQLNLF